MDPDDDYYGSRNFFVEILFDYGRTAAFVAALASTVFALAAYAIARSRQAREPFGDPQFGLKFGLSYFKMMAFHALLVGGVLLVFTVLMKSKEKADVYRPAFGLIVPDWMPSRNFSRAIRYSS